MVVIRKYQFLSTEFIITQNNLQQAHRFHVDTLILAADADIIGWGAETHTRNEGDAHGDGRQDGTGKDALGGISQQQRATTESRTDDTGSVAQPTAAVDAQSCTVFQHRRLTSL